MDLKVILKYMAWTIAIILICSIFIGPVIPCVLAFLYAIYLLIVGFIKSIVRNTIKEK